MTSKYFKAPETRLARDIRAAAAVYANKGQAERAEGMLQAANMVDELVARGDRLTADPKGARKEDTGQGNHWRTRVEQRLAALEELAGDGAQRSHQDFARVVPSASVAPPAVTTFHNAFDEEPGQPVYGRGNPRTAAALKKATPRPADRAGLSICEFAILVAAEQLGGRTTILEIALLTAYSATSGSFLEAVRDLKGAGYLIEPDDDGIVEVHASGHAKLVDATAGRVPASFHPVGHALLRRWIGKLDTCAGKLLRFIAEEPRIALAITQVADATEYSATSGNFLESLRDLRHLRLVVIDKGPPKTVSLSPLFATLIAKDSA